MIEYKKLDFLRYPNYKIDNQGNIYRFRFWRSNLNESQCLEIKLKYITKSYSQKQLAKTFDTTQSTISRVLKTNKKDFWIKMKPLLNKSGYCYICLYNNKINKRYTIHKLVLLSFVGPCPDGMECCHNDGNTLHNSLSNLRYDTIKNNNIDKKKHGTVCKGENHGRAKLSQLEVLDIIEKCKNGYSQAYMANKYKVCCQTISNIVNYRTWKCI